MLYSVPSRLSTVAERAGVSYSWLSKFANGRIRNPGFETLTKLRHYFKTHKVKKG